MKSKTHDDENLERKCVPIFLSNKLSATIIIPIGMARRKGMDKPHTKVIVEEMEEGLLVRKIQN